MNGLDAAVQKETAVLIMMDASCLFDFNKSDDTFGFDGSENSIFPILRVMQSANLL